MQPVVHSTPVWLPLTQLWMHQLVAGTEGLGPGPISTTVVCEQTRDLDRFPVADLRVAPPDGAGGRLLRRARLRRSPPLLAQTLRQRAAETGTPALLHSHFGDVGWTNRAAARRAGSPHVVSFYGMDASLLVRKNPRWRRRYPELFASAARVVVEGPAMGGTLEALGCPADKLAVIRIGIDTAAVPFEPRSRAAGEPLRVLLAASFREKKGFPDAVRALGLVARETPVALTIIGDASRDAASDREKREILTALDETGLRAHTRLLGYQPHATLRAEAYRHHVVLQPSRVAADGDSEGGSPVALTELVATGLIGVGTRHCDIPELLIHGETGRLADEGDVEGLARELRWVADHPDAWGGLARAARHRVEAEYDLAVQCARMASLYHDVARAAT